MLRSRPLLTRFAQTFGTYTGPHNCAGTRHATSAKWCDKLWSPGYCRAVVVSLIWIFATMPTVQLLVRERKAHGGIVLPPAAVTGMECAEIYQC
ncbi:MAG: hypothetical protein U0Y68_14395 [Blastocatellia bacterium]